MDHYHEEEKVNGKLFNRQVTGMLIRYIAAHKGYLFFSLGFVVVVCAVTLGVPYMIKTIIDRLIVKQGSVVLATDRTKGGIDPSIAKRIAESMRLSDSSYFIMQSDFSYLSKKDINRLTRQGVLRQGKYTLVESPHMTPPIEAKLKSLIAEGQAQKYPLELYLIRSEGLKRFSVHETALLRSRDLKRLGFFVLVILGAFSLQFMASYFQNVSLTQLSQKAMRDLRKDLFIHLLSLNLSFFDKNPIGKLVNRVTNDIEALNEMFSSVLITLFQDLLILAGIIVIMFSTSVTLGLIVALTFPALIAITIVFRSQARKAYRSIRTKIAVMNAFLNENISGIRIVQIFVQEAKQARKFASINHGLFEANMKQVYINGVFRPLIELFRWLALAGIICVGAHLIVGDRISYGLVVMFMVYIGTFFEPLGDLAEKFDTMQSATAAGEKILLLFNAPEAKEFEIAQFSDATAAQEQRWPRGGSGGHGVSPGIPEDSVVRFDDVWFAYTSDEWVLKGVSFSIEKDRTLAIVGETGSGKTTIASLLTRFYVAQKGTISIGGVPIDDIPYGALRRSVAMVMQDVFLFSTTVAANITLDAPFDKEAFDRACRLSHCDRFIAGLPHGADEPVMERGTTFSAGERQLIAFARALYFDPSILILDEATSNIDTETERLIQDAIAHLIRGRTSLIIAHRLSTIRSADEIIVLDKGVIAERGDHGSLLAKKGLYYDLYSLQFEAA
jgi:ATP-binding cassette subfamily B protein/subfamily B ATP-binding cassette protein MsbA